MGFIPNADRSCFISSQIIQFLAGSARGLVFPMGRSRQEGAAVEVCLCVSHNQGLSSSQIFLADMVPLGLCRMHSFLSVGRIGDQYQGSCQISFKISST